LQGQLEAAEAVFDALPDAARADKRAVVGRVATRAVIATLRGDHTTAMTFIEAAIDAEKAGTRRRNVFPESRAFALALLSLVRLDTPQANALLVRSIRAGQKLGIQPEIVACVCTASSVQGSHLGNGGWMWPSESLTLPALWHGLACCWRGQFDDYRRQPRWLNAFTGYQQSAMDNEYPWLIAECHEVVSRAGEVFTLAQGQSIETFGERADQLHRSMGTTTLASLVKPMEAWEYPLKALEQLAFATSAKPTRKGSKTQRQRRLVWHVHGAEYAGVWAEPMEQTGYKNGTWSQGRTMSLKRLRDRVASMDFLLEQGRAAAAAIGQAHYGRRTDRVLGEKGLYALAGHPHVVNADGEHVEVVRCEPELLIEPQSDGRIVATIGPHGDEWDSDYAAVLATDTRLEVTRFTASHKRLFEIIPEDGLTLPAAAKERLLEAVSTLAAEVRVQSGIEDSRASSATVVAADREPWVRLLPTDAGLSATLVVEPVPETGTYMAPGAGGVTVFANRNGEALQAARDLSAERAAVDRLVEVCPLLGLAGDPLGTLNFVEPEQCLELLDQLHDAGARCLWPEGERMRIVARAETSQLRLSIKSAQEWFHATGELSIDENRVLDLQRLFELLEATPRSRFLELEDGQFLALTDSFRRQLDELRGVTTMRGAAVRVHPLAVAGLDELFEQSQLDADTAWAAQRARLREAQSIDAEIPSTLQADLRPYQEEGFRWLVRLSHWGVGACLADDMGLGKTVQTVALLLHRAADGPALVVAPTSVAPNWIAEITRFAPTLNIVPYTGTPSARATLLERLAPFDVVIATYGLLHNDIERFAAVEWHSAVLDEAQAIKNAATRRARAAFTLDARFRLVTTGTPIQNNLMDLHSLFSFINPGLLNSAAQFRERFLVPIERDNDAQARARLRRLITPFVLRRLKSEVLDDLPERTEITLHVELSKQEAALYETLRRRAVEDLDAEANKGAGSGERHLQVLAHLTRLRLACCNPRLVQEVGAPESAKLITFAETLQELLDNRHKVLVFSQFVTHLKLIEAYLKRAHISYQYLDGRTPSKKRTERIAAFQGGQGDVFLISLKAGGTGLNLTAADYVMHMDPWWNPAVEDQASDRAHRIGQTRPVTIYRLVAKGTIEEQIVELHHHKRDLADRLLEGTDSNANLDADALLELIRRPMTS
ncbi:MAG: DEAD/DEAH box helicase, partial [Gammaproteobacteria bacterium]|nr:DEAD/DEAH box helicase [Gammaproteobacteria bacterium]